MVASQKTTVPIINGGDGGHFHPTQTLTDLLTIKRKKGRLSDMTVGLCGDLKFSRTVHSLIEAMLRYENVKFVLISPNELQVPAYVKEKMDAAGAEWKEVERLEDAMEELDILYMTRVQRTILQRRRLCKTEGQLHTRPGKAAGREGRPDHHAPAASSK